MPTITPTPFYRALGNAVRVHRRLATDPRTGHSMPQYVLADMLGMVASGISQIESGQRRPPVELVARIASVLGVDVSALVPAYPIEEHTVND